MALQLILLPGAFAVCRLPPEHPIPEWARGAFVSVTRTDDELSVVCPQENVPEEVQREANWRCMKVQGPLDFALTGLLASLLTPLAEKGISVLPIGTYDTDYVLIKDADTSAAVQALRQSGHSIQTRHVAELA